MAFSPLTDKPCKSDILAWGCPPPTFQGEPKVITSSDLEASQPVIFSELLNRAARAKQATNWGQHQTKIFLTNQHLLQANSPRTMTSTNASLQVRKFTDNMSLHASSYWLLTPRDDRPDNKPNLGQRRSGGLKLQQSTNSSHVVILVANSNDKRLQRSCGLNLNIRPLVKVSLRGVWNPTPNSLFGWRNKLDVEKWQEATWSQTERTLIDDIFFEK